LTVVVSRYSEEELEAFQTRAELRDERKNLESEVDSTDEPESKNEKARSSKEESVEEESVEEESVEEDLDSDEENDEQNEKEAN